MISKDLPKYSNRYYDIVQDGQKFHIENKTWSGGGTSAYAEDIRLLAINHNVSTLLDYGCGKGLHYVPNSIKSFGQDAVTFDKYIGVTSVYKFDPCVPQFEKHPPADSKFDAVIAIQSLNLVPDVDMPIVVQQLMAMTQKFCFIGINLKAGKIKKGKQTLEPDADFKGNRLDPKWWHKEFANWHGSELILKFIE